MGVSSLSVSFRGTIEEVENAGVAEFASLLFLSFYDRKLVRQNMSLISIQGSAR